MAQENHDNVPPVDAGEDSIRAPIPTPTTRGAEDGARLSQVLTQVEKDGRAVDLDRQVTLAEHMTRMFPSRTREVVDTEAITLAELCLDHKDRNDEEISYFRRGAVLAWGAKCDTVDCDIDQSPEEAEWLRKENSKSRLDNFKQKCTLYLLATLCGLAAVVQGMDQAAVNGAQVGYKKEFGITNVWIEGLVNGAPYLCCSVIGCWTAPFLNNFFGRKGTIFISCLFAIASSIWQMCTHSTWDLFAARFIMGLAIGAKSSTTPAYSAECAPANIRGAIGTQWQMWTAFGIMLGLIVDVAFMNVHTPVWGEYSGWRIILGSTAAPALFVCALIPFVPESPRWYIGKGRYSSAYKSLCRLRNCKLQAARDIYEIDSRFKWEQAWKDDNQVSALKRSFKLFTIPRNRRGAQSAAFLMLMQQMCGVNVIAYYSTQIFRDAGSTVQQALLFSLGAGIINWIGAIPGTLTIDKAGRRALLLTTFPLMFLCLLFTGCGFYAPSLETRSGLVGTGIYLFMVVYSPGMGPVPFTYSAEAQPLEVRDVGMSFATAICWGFNFILALTFPPMVETFTISGAFFFYAAWNLIGWVYTYFCLPETSNLVLEQLDERFSVELTHFARYNWYKLTRKHLPEDLLQIKEIMATPPPPPKTEAERQEEGKVRSFFKARPLKKMFQPRTSSSGNHEPEAPSNTMAPRDPEKEAAALAKARTESADTSTTMYVSPPRDDMSPRDLVKKAAALARARTESGDTSATLYVSPSREPRGPVEHTEPTLHTTPPIPTRWPSPSSSIKTAHFND